MITAADGFDEGDAARRGVDQIQHLFLMNAATRSYDTAIHNKKITVGTFADWRKTHLVFLFSMRKNDEREVVANERNARRALPLL